MGGVVMTVGGVLYGTTNAGGTSQFRGTVFGLEPPASPGGPWTEVVLHRFEGAADGRQPAVPDGRRVRRDDPDGAALHEGS